MNNKDKLSAAKARLGAFAKTSPSLFEGFSKISQTATREGNFTAAQKELIATAVAMSSFWAAEVAFPRCRLRDFAKAFKQRW